MRLNRKYAGELLTYKDSSIFVNTNLANIGIEKGIRMLYSVAFKNRDGLFGPAFAITWNSSLRPAGREAKPYPNHF